jgi:hypothetical protein
MSWPFNISFIFIVFDVCYLVSAEDFEAVPKEGRPPTEAELQQFFLPFRGFCARKGVSK